MASPAKEVAEELPNLIRVYTDGSVERLFGSPYVPPSINADPDTGVSSKDITIAENPKISARLYIPKLQKQDQKLPVLIYFHGGGFCIGSAFSFVEHRFISLLVSQGPIVAVSVEYRLAPEDLLPAAYEDCWTALNWVASHSKAQNEPHRDPWLLDYVDFDRIYVGGDSAGGNIAHNMAMRAGFENLEANAKILGVYLGHGYFWGSKPIGSETVVDHDKAMSSLVWNFVYPSAPLGLDNPMINPEGPGAPSLAKLGCSRLLVCLAENDFLRDRGARHHDLVKESGWSGELELYEVKGEGHCFYVFDTETTNAKNMIRRLTSFLRQTSLPSI